MPLLMARALQVGGDAYMAVRLAACLPAIGIEIGTAEGGDRFDGRDAPFGEAVVMAATGLGFAGQLSL